MKAAGVGNHELIVVFILRERVDKELGEKGRIRSDLEKTEKLKAQLAVEVDERHAAIEQTNNQNLRYLTHFNILHRGLVEVESFTTCVAF